MPSVGSATPALLTIAQALGGACPGTPGAPVLPGTPWGPVWFQVSFVHSMSIET